MFLSKKKNLKKFGGGGKAPFGPNVAPPLIRESIKGMREMNK